MERAVLNAVLNKVMVGEVTSIIRRIPQEVAVGRGEGLRHSSVVNLDNVHVVPTACLGDRIGAGRRVANTR
jgi:mRNA-degrading endonuclease toxin of MazEF toxin-antitoxin module